MASEDLSNLERLGQESLDLAGASDSQLILLRQLIHTKDSNDILEGLVVLWQHNLKINNVNKKLFDNLIWKQNGHHQQLYFSTPMFLT